MKFGIPAGDAMSLLGQFEFKKGVFMKYVILSALCLTVSVSSYAVVNCPATHPDSTDAVVCMMMDSGSATGHITQLVVNDKAVGQSCTKSGTVAWVSNQNVLNVYHVGPNYQSIYQCGDSACKQKILINTFTFDLSPKDEAGKYNAKPAYDTISMRPNYGPTCTTSSFVSNSAFLNQR